MNELRCSHHFTKINGWTDLKFAYLLFRFGLPIRIAYRLFLCADSLPKLFMIVPVSGMAEEYLDFLHMPAFNFGIVLEFIRLKQLNVHL